MQVEELRLTDFRGIKDCESPIRLTKLNVLVGRNNSGKSAVLQALSLLPHPRLSMPLHLRVGDVERRDYFIARKLLGGHRSLVYRYAGRASVSFKLNGQEYNMFLDENGNSTALIGERDITGKPREICQQLDISEEEAPNWAVFVPNNSEFTAKVAEHLAIDWWRVEKADIHVRVVEDLINPTIHEKFTEVFRKDQSLTVRKEAAGKPFYVDLKDLGDGIRKALSIFVFVELCSPALLLWDDFEAFAHPSLVRSLLSWLTEGQRQVVLATHSIDVLYDLAEMKPEDSQVIQLKKEADDILKHRILTVEQVDDFLSAGNDPRLLVDAIE